MASTGTAANTIGVGDRIPDVPLPTAGDDALCPLRGPHRDAVVVVALHDPGCDRCRGYLAALAGAAPRLRRWDGHVHAVAPADAGGRAVALQEELGDGVTVLLDPERQLLRRVADTGPVTLVADRYGQVFHSLEGGDGHAVMEPRELEEWLKYLATQCPE